MEFGSICSGIEAASVAWSPLGWKAAWLAEIDKFASAVLAHHYPKVPNLGDMTKIARAILVGEVPAPDVLCGGTPCQAFSVAGLRESLADERGNLTLKFVEIANAIDYVRAGRGDEECVVFWENVPGVLSTKDNAFGCFLAGLAGEDEPLVPPGQAPRPGQPYKWANAGAVYGPTRAIAWRTLDAQHFGLAQRRRRVFVIASARKGFDPAQVLFEWDGVRRDTAPSRKTGQVAPTIPSRSTAGGGLGTDFDCDGGLIAGTLQAGGKAAGSATQQDAESGLLVTCTLRGEGFDASEDGTGRGTPLVPVATAIRTANTSANGHGISPELAHTLDSAQGQCVAFDTTQITSPANVSNPKPGDPCHPLAAGAHAPAIAFPARLSGTQCASTEDLAPAMGAANPTAVAFQSSQSGVRRLTPVECERLMGFPDGYTRIFGWNGWRDLDKCEGPDELRTDGLQVKQSKKTGKWRVNDPDGPRYKALGNSWAVPNVAWLGRRIDAEVRRAS